MRLPVLLGRAVLALLVVGPLDAAHAQGVSIGLVAGRSLVAGNDNRGSPVDIQGTRVSGGDQAGIHLRGFLEAPIAQTPLSFQLEAFFNQLRSGANTFNASTGTRAALQDRSGGLMGTFTIVASRSARLAPYFSFGGGIMATELGTNPQPGEPTVTARQGGMGLGLAAGSGFRLRTRGPTLLLDWRYYQALNNTRGSAFMPISIGVSF